MDLKKLRAETDEMQAQLKILAERECDNCFEKDCADCWALKYCENKSLK